MGGESHVAAPKQEKKKTIKCNGAWATIHFAQRTQLLRMPLHWCTCDLSLGCLCVFTPPLLAQTSWGRVATASRGRCQEAELASPWPHADDISSTPEETDSMQSQEPAAKKSLV